MCTEKQYSSSINTKIWCFESFNVCETDKGFKIDEINFECDFFQRKLCLFKQNNDEHDVSAKNYCYWLPYSIKQYMAQLKIRYNYKIYIEQDRASIN